jgi:hypothetical protein
MSLSKRLWEEEQSREYETSSDTICAQCFHDNGIKAFIRDHLEFETCSICGTRGDDAIAAPADEVLEFFLEKIHENFENADGNAPYDNEEGKWFVRTWDMYDLVFDELEGIADHRTLEWLFEHLKDNVEYCKRDWQIMSPGEALKSAWGRFCDAIKHQTRFLFFDQLKDDDSQEPYLVQPAEMLDEIGGVIRECNLVREIKRGTRMFRGRGHVPREPFTEVVDLGPPPQSLAKSAGRMNAAGIVVMYASLDRETALAEATGKHNEFSIAEFELLKTLVVVDLTNIPPVPSIFMDGPRESLQFLRHFARDVSQPFTPDTEIHIEYTPTQAVSEYMRHRLRDRDGRPINGMLYKSAKEIDKVNVVLFVESEDVEGVPSSKRWKVREPILKIINIEEATKIEEVKTAD